MWNPLRGLKKKAKNAVKFLRKNAKTFVFCAGTAIALGSANVAHAEVTLPTNPIVFSDYADAGMVVIGTVIGATTGIVVIVALIRMGIRAMTRAFNGRA